MVRTSRSSGSRTTTRNQRCLFQVEGVRTTIRRGPERTSVPIRARTGAEAKRKAKNLRKFRILGIVGGRSSQFQPFERAEPRIISCPPRRRRK